MHRHVRPITAVHPEHAERQGMITWETTEAH
jgi:hypothetical protein